MATRNAQNVIAWPASLKIWILVSPHWRELSVSRTVLSANSKASCGVAVVVAVSDAKVCEEPCSPTAHAMAAENLATSSLIVLI